MKKPSEKIKEIVYASTGGGIGSVEITLWAIAKYLDEEWEKNKHESHAVLYEDNCSICQKDKAIEDTKDEVELKRF